MALPEPTPPVTGKAGRQFKERLDDTRVAPEAARLYQGAKHAYRRKPRL